MGCVVKRNRCLVEKSCSQLTCVVYIRQLWPVCFVVVYGSLCVYEGLCCRYMDKSPLCVTVAHIIELLCGAISF